MQPLPVRCTVFARSGDGNGVTGEQELQESSEDCVAAAGSSTVQVASPWWSAVGRLPAPAASVPLSVGLPEHWPC